MRKRKYRWFKAAAWILTSAWLELHSGTDCSFSSTPYLNLVFVPAFSESVTETIIIMQKNIKI